MQKKGNNKKEKQEKHIKSSQEKPVPTSESKQPPRAEHEWRGGAHEQQPGPSGDGKQRGWEKQKKHIKSSQEKPVPTSESKQPPRAEHEMRGKAPQIQFTKQQGDVKKTSEDLQHQKIKQKSGLFKKEEEQAVMAYPKRIFVEKKSGQPIKVEANYFPLDVKNEKNLVYHYDVTISPDKPNFLMRKVWNQFSKEQFENRITVYDGGKNVFSRGPLIKNLSHSAKVIIMHPDNGKNKEFNVDIQEVRQVDLSVLNKYKEAFNKEGKMPEAEIAVLDIILKNWPANYLVPSGKSFFPKIANLRKEEVLSERLHLRFGFFQSAVFCNRPYLNFDISFKSFYKDCNLLSILSSFEIRNRDNQYVLDEDSLNHFIKGMKIIYELPNIPESRRSYRVNKLVKDACNQTFQKEDGSSMRVADYYAKEKNYSIRNPKLPLLWVGPNQKTIYVPLECCKIAPDQVYKGEMTPKETREMVHKATSNARDRKKKVEEIFRNSGLNTRTNEYLQEFGISVSDKMAVVDGRVLNPPSLKTTKPVRVKEGVWRTDNFYEPKSLNKWCLLNLDQRARREDLDNFQKLIRSKGEQFKMNIGNPAMNPVLGDSRPAGLKKNLSDLKNMDLVFVIIPDHIKNLYSRVKTICETEEGILTQCIKSKTLQQDYRKISTTIENILLKVNAKLGGKNHCLENYSVPSCLNGYVMILGADVTHSGPGSRIPSVAAVAVSCDPLSFQYKMSYRVQKGEIIQDMQEIIKLHLENFYEVRKHYPEKIIFFRDGVSEGELPKVCKSELGAIKSACQGKCTPKITVVVVQKRHHTRLYPFHEKDEVGKNFNVPVGTCVDTEIVHPLSLDFFLVSHMSILGTARPTRYRLIYDENNLKDEEVEELSFFLCHLYARCNRSVSYPSPTYNAHLGAYRVRAYLDTISCANLELPEIQRKIPDRISYKSPMFFV